MEIPTKEWLTPDITGTMGSYVDWNGVGVDAEFMIDNFLTAIVGMMQVDSGFDLATIYTKASPTAPAVPVRSKTLSIVGTASAIGPAKAIQSTLNMRTVGIHPFKIVLLDQSALATNLDKIVPSTFPTRLNNVVDVLVATSHAWSGRDDTRPASAISYTATESKALRRRYRMG